MMGQETRQPRYELPLRVSARAEYAIRAALELATSPGGLVKGERIAHAQDIPLKFLMNILIDLRRARLVRSHRGSDGGFQLAQPPEEITLADVIRAVEGSLHTVQNDRPDERSYPQALHVLQDVWSALAATIDALLASVTLADLAEGTLPASLHTLAGLAGAQA